MEITPIPCLTDNYAYIIYDNDSKTTGVFDPSEANPIISFLKKKTTANRDPTCALIFIKSSSSLKPNKFESKFRWADELTGRNSVIP